MAKVAGLLLIVMTTICACGPQATTPASSDNSSSRKSNGPKTLTAAILGDPPTLSQTVNTAGTGSVRGVGEVELLVASGMTVSDGEGMLHPVLAESVPSIDNGLWVVYADGRMETTWKIRPNVQWHDGSTFTSADLVFTLALGRDKEVALLRVKAFDWIDKVEAPDDATVKVIWKQPFVDADQLFTQRMGLPVPRHILEPLYSSDKAGLLDEPYWTTAYVGMGPFQLSEFVRGSHMRVTASDRYVLGRPKLDEITVMFIPDPNTLMANLLAGKVSLTLGRGLSLEQALQASSQWKNGRMEGKTGNWIALYPQYNNPTPPEQALAPFRRAVLYGFNRQEINDSLQSGKAPVADSFVSPRTVEYKAVQDSIVRYEYDPRRALQSLQDVGFTRGPDDSLRRGSGEKLAIEVRTSGGDDLREKILFSIMDYWRRLGIDPQPYVVPDQLAHDLEERASRPAFELVRQPFDPVRFHSKEIPNAEGKWRGKNRSAYSNFELDGLIDQYYVTIPRRERMALLGQMVHILSDQVVALGTLFSIDAMLVGNDLVGLVAAEAATAVESWNAQEWDIQ